MLQDHLDLDVLIGLPKSREAGRDRMLPESIEARDNAVTRPPENVVALRLSVIVASLWAASVKTLRLHSTANIAR